MQTSCSKILSSPHFIPLRSFFCIRKAVNIETLSSTAVSFKTELFTSVHSRTVSLPWWLHEENASLCHPRKVHCALSADLPRPRAKRDVNGNEKFLWSLVYDWSALRKDQSSRDRREFGAKTASIFVWNSSDFREISFVAITYVFNLIFKLLQLVLYSEDLFVIVSRLCWTLLIGICCFFSLMNLTVGGT